LRDSLLGVVTKVALFEWTAGGHRPVYVRRFIEALQPFADIVLALPQATLDAIDERDVETLSLGESRPPLGTRLRRRAVLAQEVEHLRRVAAVADHTLHLYADHVLFHLANATPLPGAISLILYTPRAHYADAYGTRLPVADRAVALAKEWAARRWRRRSDAQALFTLDEEAAARWKDLKGAPAQWLPEPPVLPLPSEQRPSERSGCVLYGALAPRKGIDLLVRALTVEPTSMRVVLAGSVEPAYLVELHRHVAAMETAGVDVELRAWQHSELEGLQALAGARCALLPYPRHAGMSRVLIEACSVVTPILADGFGLLGHLVRQHGLGLTVDCTDARALRQAALSLVQPENSASYTDALERFAARFAPERFSAALLAGLEIPSTRSTL
jgi:glycosyltransferase involved in cell wall biosynthesis